jgi:hypothetical protein
MTPQDIERIAREAGLIDAIDDVNQAFSDWKPEVSKFAALLLEEVAKVCDERQGYDLRWNHIEGAYSSAICATNIRTLAASIGGKGG